MQLTRPRLRDAGRIAIQTVAATAATYAAMRLLGSPHVSWAVISAIFSIQVSLDGTLGAGLGRIAGTAVGTAIGLGIVHFLGGEPTIVRLVLAAGLTSAISGLWPGLNYAAVAAVVMALLPHSGLEEALGRAGAIVIGTVAGTVASLAVWPELGRDRALRFIVRALGDCRDLMQTALAGLAGADGSNTAPAYSRFADNLDRARALAQETRFRRRLEHGASLRDILGAVEGLWYGIVILDRATRHELRGVGCGEEPGLQRGLQRFQESACAYLDGLVGYLQGSGPLPSPQALDACSDAAEAFVGERAAEPGREGDPEQRRFAEALSFALREIVGNLRQVGSLAADGPRAAGAARPPARSGSRTTA